jgi:serine/threonine protein kinase
LAKGQQPEIIRPSTPGFVAEGGIDLIYESATPTMGQGGDRAMAASEKSRASDASPHDFLPVLRNSGVLTDRQFTEVRAKVLSGDYPNDARALGDRLIRERLLTEYQVRRLLANKPNGMVLGRYVIQDRIGSGSMGRVYKAQHQLMGRIVALKIIAPEIVSNERAVSRFYREMRLVGRLDHPNVVRAYDADSSANVLYIVMEYVEGQSLAQMLKRGALPPVDVVGYAAQAALGLAHAHEQGIVHRDIKPSNLLVTGDKQIKVLDLGLGVLMDADNHATFATADGIAVGTVDYMSPEQACGKDVDGRSDLYSLGCAMYHLITGRQAFPGESPIERLGKRIHGRPVPITDLRPDLPPSLVAVMDKLMASKPQDRYQTGTEAADALNALVRVRKAALPRPEPPAAPPPPVKAPIAETVATIIRIEPTFPGWFRPLARLAEFKPKATLALTAGAIFVFLGIGVVIGRLLR